MLQWNELNLRWFSSVPLLAWIIGAKAQVEMFQMTSFLTGDVGEWLILLCCFVQFPLPATNAINHILLRLFLLFLFLLRLLLLFLFSSFIFTRWQKYGATFASNLLQWRFGCCSRTLDIARLPCWITNNEAANGSRPIYIGRWSRQVQLPAPPVAMATPAGRKGRGGGWGSSHFREKKKIKREK